MEIVTVVNPRARSLTSASEVAVMSVANVAGTMQPLHHVRSSRAGAVYDATTAAMATVVAVESGDVVIALSSVLAYASPSASSFVRPLVAAHGPETAPCEAGSSATACITRAPAVGAALPAAHPFAGHTAQLYRYSVVDAGAQVPKYIKAMFVDCSRYLDGERIAIAVTHPVTRTLSLVCKSTGATCTAESQSGPDGELFANPLSGPDGSCIAEIQLMPTWSTVTIALASRAAAFAGSVGADCGASDATALACTVAISQTSTHALYISVTHATMVHCSDAVPSSGARDVFVVPAIGGTHPGPAGPLAATPAVGACDGEDASSASPVLASLGGGRLAVHPPRRGADFDAQLADAQLSLVYAGRVTLAGGATLQPTFDAGGNPGAVCGRAACLIRNGAGVALRSVVGDAGGLNVFAYVDLSALRAGGTISVSRSLRVQSAGVVATVSAPIIVSVSEWSSPRLGCAVLSGAVSGARVYGPHGAYTSSADGYERYQHSGAQTFPHPGSRGVYAPPHNRNTSYNDVIVCLLEFEFAPSTTVAISGLRAAPYNGRRSSESPAVAVRHAVFYAPNAAVATRVEGLSTLAVAADRMFVASLEYVGTTVVVDMTQAFVTYWSDPAHAGRADVATAMAGCNVDGARSFVPLTSTSPPPTKALVTDMCAIVFNGRVGHVYSYGSRVAAPGAGSLARGALVVLALSSGGRQAGMLPVWTADGAPCDAQPVCLVDGVSSAAVTLVLAGRWTATTPPLAYDSVHLLCLASHEATNVVVAMSRDGHTATADCDSGVVTSADAHATSSFTSGSVTWMTATFNRADGPHTTFAARGAGAGRALVQVRGAVAAVASDGSQTVGHEVPYLVEVSRAATVGCEGGVVLDVQGSYAAIRAGKGTSPTATTITCTAASAVFPLDASGALTLIGPQTVALAFLNTMPSTLETAGGRVVVAQTQHTLAFGPRPVVPFLRSTAHHHACGGGICLVDPSRPVDIRLDLAAPPPPLTTTYVMVDCVPLQTGTKSAKLLISRTLVGVRHTFPVVCLIDDVGGDRTCRVIAASGATGVIAASDDSSHCIASIAVDRGTPVDIVADLLETPGVHVVDRVGPGVDAPVTPGRVNSTGAGGLCERFTASCTIASAGAYAVVSWGASDECRSVPPEYTLLFPITASDDAVAIAGKLRCNTGSGYVGSVVAHDGFRCVHGSLSPPPRGCGSCHMFSQAGYQAAPAAPPPYDPPSAVVPGSPLAMGTVPPYAIPAAPVAPQAGAYAPRVGAAVIGETAPTSAFVCAVGVPCTSTGAPSPHRCAAYSGTPTAGAAGAPVCAMGSSGAAAWRGSLAGCARMCDPYPAAGAFGLGHIVLPLAADGLAFVADVDALARTVGSPARALGATVVASGAAHVSDALHCAHGWARADAAARTAISALPIACSAGQWTGPVAIRWCTYPAPHADTSGRPLPAARQCPAYVPPSRFKLTAGATLTNFDVAHGASYDGGVHVVCADATAMTAAVGRVSCSGGQWRGSLGGCDVERACPPYDNAVHHLVPPSYTTTTSLSTVVATSCTSTPPPPTPPSGRISCRDGHWFVAEPFSGCTPSRCTSGPLAVDGVPIRGYVASFVGVMYHGESLTITGAKDVTVACDEAAGWVGRATVPLGSVICSNGRLTVPRGGAIGCTPSTECGYHTLPQAAGYVVQRTASGEPDLAAGKVRCADGYTAAGAIVTPVCIAGSWSGRLEGCVRTCEGKVVICVGECALPVGATCRRLGDDSLCCTVAPSPAGGVSGLVTHALLQMPPGADTVVTDPANVGGFGASIAWAGPDRFAVVRKQQVRSVDGLSSGMASYAVAPSGHLSLSGWAAGAASAEPAVQYRAVASAHGRYYVAHGVALDPSSRVVVGAVSVHSAYAAVPPLPLAVPMAAGERGPVSIATDGRLLAILGAVDSPPRYTLYVAALAPASGDVGAFTLSTLSIGPTTMAAFVDRAPGAFAVASPLVFIGDDAAAGGVGAVHVLYVSPASLAVHQHPTQPTLPPPRASVGMRFGADVVASGGLVVVAAPADPSCLRGVESAPRSTAQQLSPPLWSSDVAVCRDSGSVHVYVADGGSLDPPVYHVESILHPPPSLGYGSPLVPAAPTEHDAALRFGGALSVSADASSPRNHSSSVVVGTAGLDAVVTILVAAQHAPPAGESHGAVVGPRVPHNAAVHVYRRAMLDPSFAAPPPAQPSSRPPPPTPLPLTHPRPALWTCTATVGPAAWSSPTPSALPLAATLASYDGSAFVAGAPAAVLFPHADGIGYSAATAATSSPPDARGAAVYVALVAPGGAAGACGPPPPQLLAGVDIGGWYRTSGPCAHGAADGAVCAAETLGVTCAAGYCGAPVGALRCTRGRWEPDQRVMCHPCVCPAPKLRTDEVIEGTCDGAWGTQCVLKCSWGMCGRPRREALVCDSMVAAAGGLMEAQYREVLTPAGRVGGCHVCTDSDTCDTADYLTLDAAVPSNLGRMLAPRSILTKGGTATHLLCNHRLSFCGLPLVLECDTATPPAANLALSAWHCVHCERACPSTVALPVAPPIASLYALDMSDPNATSTAFVCSAASCLVDPAVTTSGAARCAPVPGMPPEWRVDEVPTHCRPCGGCTRSTLLAAVSDWELVTMAGGIVAHGYVTTAADMACSLAGTPATYECVDGMWVSVSDSTC